MNIKDLKDALPFLIKAKLVPNIIGKHGIGKSSVIAQFAKDNGYSFHPFFLGQMSDMGDLLGLPEFNRDSSGRAISTSFIHPAKLPKNKKSILFFDELNRATKDLLQGIFQLALEGTLHDYVLPEDSAIIMAMNPATDDYSVLDFADKAFTDRFCHIHLDPTHEEFHTYMLGKFKTSNVSEFLKQQTKLLEEEDLQPVSLDFVKPSRRSWDRLQILENTGIPESLLSECGMGLVGVSAMVSYNSFKKSKEKILKGSDILDNYKTVSDKFISYFKDSEGNMLDESRNDVVSTVCNSVVDELELRLRDKLVSEELSLNFLNFTLDIPVEYCLSVMQRLQNNIDMVTDQHFLNNVLDNEKLANKLLDAVKAKEEYKKNIVPDDIPF